MTQAPWAVVDIDGVLADVRHRVRFVEQRPKDWDAFFAAAPLDPALAEGLAAVAEQVALGRAITYVSGRPERCRADTVDWMKRHGLPPAPLHLRRDDDRRPARHTKLAIVRTLERTAPVAVIIDDDAAVVEAMRAAGFNVLHAQWMGGGTDGVDASPAQEALFEAQELEGRT